MPLLIPSDHALVRLDFLRTGSAERQAITLAVEDLSATSTAAAVGTAVNNAWSAANSFRSVLNPLTNHTNTHVILGQLGPDLVADVAGTGVGTATAGALAPPAVAPVVSKVTGFGGRRYRGRFYFPDIKESSVDDGGVIVGSALTTYQTAANTFLSALAAANFPMRLLHTTNDLPTSVTSLLVRSLVGTQRGRQARS